MSEEAYVRDLSHVTNNILFKLTKFKVITEQESKKVFGNIKTICKANSAFLDQLMEYKKEVFPIYKDISPFLINFFQTLFDVYNKQCQSIEDSNKKIENLKQNPNFTSFMGTLTSSNSNVDPIASATSNKVSIAYERVGEVYS
eukprot:Pgem_evm2s3463